MPQTWKVSVGKQSANRLALRSSEDEIVTASSAIKVMKQSEPPQPPS